MLGRGQILGLHISWLPIVVGVDIGHKCPAIIKNKILFASFILLFFIGTGTFIIFTRKLFLLNLQKIWYI
jgi:hypothetical protein